MRYLFEQPWPGVAMIGIAGIIVVVVGLRSRGLGLAALGLVLLLASPGPWLLDRAVITERERVASAARRAVRYAGAGRVEPLGRLFAAGAVLTGPEGGTRHEIPAALERLGRFEAAGNLEDCAVAEMAVRVDGRAVATSELTVSSTLEGGRPLATRWRLHWRRGADGGWRIVEAQWLELQGRAPSPGAWP